MNCISGKIRKIKFVKSRKYRGFSFMEVMLAVFILEVGLVAVVQLLSKNTGQLIDSRNQVIAGLLAQEGVELVRNIRDANWKDADPTTNSFDGICILPCSVSNARIDYTYVPYLGTNMPSGDISDKTFNGLYLNSDGFYTHSAGGSPSPFYRRITLVSNGTEAIGVTSMVIWGNNNFPSDINMCTAGAKCTYSIINLSKWGE